MVSTKEIKGRSRFVVTKLERLSQGVNLLHFSLNANNFLNYLLTIFSYFSDSHHQFAYRLWTDSR